MEYELINPNDPYTFIAKDYETAVLTVFLISTMYGANSKDGEDDIPIFLFGGSREWYKRQFNRTPDEGLSAKKHQVVDSLESFMYGSFEDRKRYQAALNAITDADKKEQFVREWQDGRSSLNNIGGYAHNLAKKMKGELKEQQADSRQNDLVGIFSEIDK